jgi:RimJ/RimL family protein N-acetyltransferase
LRRIPAGDILWRRAEGIMKYFPKVSGERVYLSPISVEDAERYAIWLNDLETTRFLLQSAKVISLQTEREALASLSKEQNYAVVEKGSDELLGNCGLMDLSPVHRSAEVGIFLGEEGKRGKGYGSEALRLLCDYAFNVLNLESLSLRVYDFNLRAQAAYRKVGFKEAGRLRKAHFYGGAYHDILVMDLLSEEFGPSALPGAKG